MDTTLICSYGEILIAIFFFEVLGKYGKELRCPNI